MLKQSSLEKIKVGMEASAIQKMTDEKIKLFADISGDKNPIHLDEEFAKNSIYKKRIAHGMHYASLFSSIFGTKLPGNGCVIFEQSLKFKRPVYVGDKVLATVKVIRVDVSKKKIFFETVCKVNNKIVTKGYAGIFIP